MKKVYEKPEILFEDFSLSTHIAADCEVKPNDPDLEYPGVGFVFSTGCDWPVDTSGGDGEYNQICYHVVKDNVNVFQS